MAKQHVRRCPIRAGSLFLEPAEKERFAPAVTRSDKSHLEVFVLGGMIHHGNRIAEPGSLSEEDVPGQVRVWCHASSESAYDPPCVLGTDLSVHCPVLHLSGERN